MYNIILINPPVYDFTYYNLWEKPLGLLNIAAAFEKDERCRLSLIDCVPERLQKKREYDRGAGKLTGVRTEKPECFKTVRRNYHRYGIGAEELEARLAEAAGNIPAGEPAAVLISAMMTYWYQGAFEAAREARKAMPQAKIAIGGIYARLMPGHAGRSELFDHVETGYGAFKVYGKILEILNIPVPAGLKCENARGDFGIIPAYHLLPELNNSVSLLASSGCPYRCTYCASNILYSEYSIKPAGEIIEELLYYKNSLKVNNAAFYDDALLYRKEENFYAWARGWIKAREASGNGGEFSFHLPNAVHAAMIDEECASLMKEAGFKTVRLGYEFYESAKQKESGGKVSGGALKKAVANLINAGFTPNEIGVYILFGHPGCGGAEARDAADFVFECGATPHLSLFSPIPGTPDGEAIFRLRPEILSEPLLQNKSVYFELFSEAGYGEYYELKAYIQKKSGGAVNNILINP
jgi:radical SAM superfamily enzyme YgiQ (UPF0313 family)